MSGSIASVVRSTPAARKTSVSDDLEPHLGWQDLCCNLVSDADRHPDLHTDIRSTGIPFDGISVRAGSTGGCAVSAFAEVGFRSDHSIHYHDRSVFAWAMEWLGSSMGVPFGKYSYTQDLLPQIGCCAADHPYSMGDDALPGMGGSDRSCCDRTGKGLGRAYPLIFAMLSGLAFTAWDLYLDPQMVAGGLWTWEDLRRIFRYPCAELSWVVVGFDHDYTDRPSR